MGETQSLLDDLSQISKLDSAGMGQTIEAIPQSLLQTWKELKNWPKLTDFSQIQNIVTVGMGGSGLGADFVDSLFGDELKIPYVIVNDYILPEFVDGHSLVFLISYSGNTAETLKAGEEAVKRKAKILVITTGGKLADFAKNFQLPAWIFTPKFNYCGQPRAGIGYLILGQILILAKLGLIDFSENDFQKILSVTQDANNKWRREVKTEKNLAKSTSLEIFGKIPVIFAAQFLRGNAHILANQINENAKTPAFWLKIPEAAHHFLESVKSTQTADNLIFINLISQFFDDGIKKRFEITKELALQNQIKVIDISLEAGVPLEECFTMLILSSWISFYLAIMQEIDPTPISTVNFFKQKLFTR